MGRGEEEKEEKNTVWRWESRRSDKREVQRVGERQRFKERRGENTRGRGEEKRRRKREGEKTSWAEHTWEGECRAVSVSNFPKFPRTFPVLA